MKVLIKPLKNLVMQITVIQKKIFEIRGQKVMLDLHLAELYEVETKRLKEAVKRNINRFPSDFMFELTDKELHNLRSQIATSSWGGSRYKPYAFTEQGVAMLSSILNSEKAIDVNIFIIRTFVLIRQYALDYQELEKKIKSLEKKHNKNFKQLFTALELLLQEKQADEKQKANFENRPRIGFKQGKKE
jgi:hypothetical protein